MKTLANYSHGYPISFLEHTYLRRMRMMSLWTAEEIVYGNIGCEIGRNPLVHCFDEHFRAMGSNFSSLNKALSVLKPLLPAVKTMAFPSFEDLYSWVDNQIGGISGIGRVTIYDVALRMGINQYPKVIPENYVYITSHSVRESAEKLLNRKITDIRIHISVFSGIFPHYTAMEIEDILCVYHNVITGPTFDLSLLLKMP